MIDRLDDRVEQLRRKTADVTVPDSHASEDAAVGTDQIIVIDDVLPDPLTYRAAALARSFRSIPMGPVTFHGIAECDDPSLPGWITGRFPSARPGLTFFRRSPAGQQEPNYIHTDRDMGDWTAILYLNPDPPADDGTAFLRHVETGANASTATSEAQFHHEWREWRDLAKWTRWHTVSAKFNRLLLFHAPLFHSRAIADNYGDESDARLIQLVFGVGTLRGAGICA